MQNEIVNSFIVVVHLSPETPGFDKSGTEYETRLSIRDCLR
jgi:hypothetical protein